jgi:hypothetical protein
VCAYRLLKVNLDPEPSLVASFPIWNQIECTFTQAGPQWEIVTTSQFTQIVDASSVALTNTRMSPRQRIVFQSRGGYVVAARGRKYFPLTDAEEAEFQKAMYGRREPAQERNVFLGLLAARKH